MYAIRPASTNRKAALALAKAYKGTESDPTIPREFQPFITSALHDYRAQHELNPIDQYNAANPMAVESMSPYQRLAMGFAAGNLQQSPLTSIALQAAQRGAGMAGSGPTTGQYDVGGEMGLQDWAQLMQPWVARGGELGSQSAPMDFQAAASGANAPPVGPAPPNFAGGPPQMAQGYGGGSPGGGGGTMPPPGGGGGPRPPIQTGSSGGNDWTNPENASLQDFLAATSKYGIHTSGLDPTTGLATISGLTPNANAGVGRGYGSFSFGGHGAPGARADLREHFAGQGMSQGDAYRAANQITEAGRRAAETAWTQKTHDPNEGWIAAKHSAPKREKRT